MGVSFKVAKAGTRYNPRPRRVEGKADKDGLVSEFQLSAGEGKISGIASKVAEHSNSLTKSALHLVSEGLEASFSLNVFLNGFAIGKATEFFNEEPKQLHPYDRASETLFSAIEHGWLPGDLFDDIPCKFVNGALLCEIRDYRDSFPQKEGNAALVKSPIVHKLLLRMCMENVVKDISLISDNSWTYEDLLKIESRILKALQPDLHLNPEPLQERYYGELLRKKIDLGIAWSWKRRKLSDATATNTSFINPYHVTQISGSCAIQNSSSPQSGLAYQDRGLTSLQHKILSSNLSPQENNIVAQHMSTSNSLVTDNQLADGWNQQILTDLITSNSVCIPRQHFSNCNSDPTKSILLVSGEKGRSETEALQKYIAKKPKQEPVDFFQRQLPGSQAECCLAPEQQWKNDLHQHIVAKNIRETCLSAISKSTGRLRELAPYSVNQETAETVFCGTDNRKTIDNCFLMKRRVSQSKCKHVEQRPLSQLLGATTPHYNSLQSHITQPVNRSLRNESATQKRKNFQYPLVTTGPTIHAQHNGSLARDASVPAKWKTNSQVKGLNMKVVGSSVIVNTSNAANGNSVPFGNIPQEKPPETEVDSVLERLLKIVGVTQRYGLNKRERKLDQFLQRKPFFQRTPLVAFPHLSSEDDKSLNVCKTRTLTFVRQHHVYEDDIPMVDREAQIALVISEKVNEGIFEARIHHGDQEIGSFVSPLLSSVSRQYLDFDPFMRSHNVYIKLKQCKKREWTRHLLMQTSRELLNFFISELQHSADSFASQFTSMMAGEGYHMAINTVGPSPFKTHDHSSIPQLVAVTDATPATGTIGPPHPTLISGPSPSSLHPVTYSLVAHNTTPLPSQNIFSNCDARPPESSKQAQQFLGSNVSNLQHDIASSVSTVQWQKIFNRHTHLQSQMQEGQRQQKLMNGNRLVGGLREAAGGLGMIQPSGSIQGLGNINIGSPSIIMGMGDSAPLFIRGHVPWIGSGSQSINLGTNISGSSESKQLGGMISDHPGAYMMANLRRAKDQWGPLISGFPIQLNAQSSSQEQLQLQIQEQPHMLLQHGEMKPFLLPQALTNIMMDNPENPEPSFWTNGSVDSCITRLSEGW